MSSAVRSPYRSAAYAAPVSAVDWARRINQIVRDQTRVLSGQRTKRYSRAVDSRIDVFSDLNGDTEPVLRNRQIAAAAPARSAAARSAETSIHFSESAAEAVVRLGLKAELLSELAKVSGLDAKDLYEFAGIDRTTVARKAAKGDALPQEVAVKALAFMELIAVASDVFGTVEKASTWLTRPHPVLDDETPMLRARTPWGLGRVKSMLGALKYGGVV